ncbi:hypothetical protein QTL97_11945 [Sporosarcina thermotolerans]|uniref:Uncharacterized protein n=2 Tax=Sporosarcina thermotolerans TaxID=633404 RepID=A0AAW9ADE8_9BACL|nr:hypothetical protein [Sporosarcina thermotolerans]MDW0117651.1 hypothetical protein [Sporosarcina thermotolerans]WHT49254.1 hypothetical protein QNH10_06460 [Sporosarcina thermotolerans]
MTKFGTEREVGEKLIEAVPPSKKGMMLTLSLTSLLFAYSVYACQLFIMGDAHILWLILAVLISTTILIVTVRPLAKWNRRFWMNSLLLVHIFINFYGFLLASDLDRPYSTGLSIIAALLLLLAIVLVYRTTIYDFPSTHKPLMKDARRLHFINITTGIFLVFVTLFFLWAFLLFSGKATLGFLMLFVPIIGWILSYALQMKLLANQQKAAAYAIVFIQTAVIVTGIVLWIIGM